MIHRLVNVAKELAPDFEKRAPQWDRTRSYCWENVSQLVDAGIMGMSIPREYGGQGASYLDVAMVVEQIAKVCTLTARVVVEGNMGGISAVMGYGTAQQKAFCAEHVLAGDKPAICITEPEAGSAATEMQTTAHKQGGSIFSTVPNTGLLVAACPNFIWFLRVFWMRLARYKELAVLSSLPIRPLRGFLKVSPSSVESILWVFAACLRPNCALIILRLTKSG